MTTLDRTSPPKSGEIRRFDFPGVERRTLPNGLDLRVGRISRLPIVTVNLFMRAGEYGLREEHAGLAALTGDALEGGTKRRSGTDMAEALERTGARLNVGSGWEGTSVSLTCLADRLEEAFPLLAETVLEPSFPDDEVERARDQQLAAIRQRSMDPASLASDEAPRRYFAPGVPYARPVGGTIESLEGVGSAQLAGYAEANYRPGAGGGLVVVGDIDTDEVAALATRHLGSWTGEVASVSDAEPQAATKELKVWLVDRPGSVQSEIRIGHIGAARSTPDYFALSVANMLFGGTFTSRLNLNLRERHGFTYGIRSRFAFRSRRGPFQVSTSVGSEVTGAAVREIMAELHGLVDAGPTEEEVAATRDFAAGIFGLQLETVGQIATRVSQLVVFGLPEDYFGDYRDRLRAVRLDEVTAAARLHVRPSEAQIIVVGDADQVRPQLEELDLGRIEVVDAGG